VYFEIETNDFKKLKTIILTTFLAVVAWLLLWFKIIIPGPLHLRFDFSLAVVLYATMLESVCYGIYIEFILWLFSSYRLSEICNSLLLLLLSSEEFILLKLSSQ